MQGGMTAVSLRQGRVDRWIFLLHRRVSLLWVGFLSSQAQRHFSEHHRGCCVDYVAHAEHLCHGAHLLHVSVLIPACWCFVLVGTSM